jgi:hypothetical protein
VGKMSECLGELDLNRVAKSALDEFDHEIASLEPELCVPFNQAAMRLEAELLTIYKFVVQIVRREEDLSKVASCWGTMVLQCDAFGRKLYDLSVAHPECGAGYYYDRVLDLRNKCQRLQKMHT